VERHSNPLLNQERSVNGHKPVLPNCPKGLQCSARCTEFIEQWSSPQSGSFLERPEPCEAKGSRMVREWAG
jgi:hypothetical protein